MCLKWCVLSPVSPCFCGAWWTRPHLASVGSGGQPFYIFNQLKRVSRFYFTSLMSLFVTVWASELEMRLLKLCFIRGVARDRHFMQTCMTAYVNMNVHYIAQLFYIQFVSPCTCDLWMSITFSLRVTSTPTAWDTSYFSEGEVFAFPAVIVLHQEWHFPSSNFNFLYNVLGVTLKTQHFLSHMSVCPTCPGCDHGLLCASDTHLCHVFLTAPASCLLWKSRCLSSTALFCV